MIPIFPSFKKLEFEDKKEIESFYTGPFLPSDYHFASLWAWDLNNDVEISKLNNNLVVKFKDYQTAKSFYSFFGKNKLEKTINSLLGYLEKNNFQPELNLLPEQNFGVDRIEKLSKKFRVQEDEDNFDYIYSIKDLLTYEGTPLYTKKKQLKKFLGNYGGNVEFVILETVNPEAQKDILAILEKWSRGKINKNEIEISALKKSLFNIPSLKFFVFCVYISGELAGFSLYEIIDKNQAIHSFQKADLSYIGITEYMNNKVAEHLNSLGVSYINAEQDLGIEGLRRAKRAYNPILLKKYTISKKSAD